MKCENFPIQAEAARRMSEIWIAPKLGGRGFTYGYRTYGRLKVFFSGGKAITVKFDGELIWTNPKWTEFPGYFFGSKVF